MFCNSAKRKFLFVLLLCQCLIKSILNEDITKQVFGLDYLNGYPVAYGDFNSDEMTDVFVIHRDNNDHRLEVLFGSDEPPLLRSFNVSCPFSKQNLINGYFFVVGDFDGDAALDILFTRRKNVHSVYNSSIRWGNMNSINCNIDTTFSSDDHPIAVDFNNDLVIELFVTINKTKTILEFPKRQMVKVDCDKYFNGSFCDASKQIRSPIISSYVDVNGDHFTDLVIGTNTGIDVCYQQKSKKFECQMLSEYPPNSNYVGQMTFVDLGLTGNLNLLLPVYTNQNISKIYLLDNNRFLDTGVNFNFNNDEWAFFIDHTNMGAFFRTFFLRSGDFNMDGYPDFLVNLMNKKNETRTFLLENVYCEKNCLIHNRKLVIQWEEMAFLNNVIGASFFDSLQNGHLDIFAVEMNNERISTRVYKQMIDEDMNFLKVMVLSDKQKTHSSKSILLNKKIKNYGTPAIGVSISYNTVTQEGIVQKSIAVQNQKSAFLPLEMPYVIFGLGKTPEFIDSLNTGLVGESKSWSPIIPNSQVVVLPTVLDNPKYWKIALFVTPSRLILYSLISLIAVCIFIIFIIGILHWKERLEDKRERLNESNFHFDAM